MVYIFLKMSSGGAQTPLATLSNIVGEKIKLNSCTKREEIQLHFAYHPILQASIAPSVRGNLELEEVPSPGKEEWAEWPLSWHFWMHKGSALVSPLTRPAELWAVGTSGNRKAERMQQKELIMLKPVTCSVNKASRFHAKETNGQQSICRPHSFSPALPHRLSCSLTTGTCVLSCSFLPAPNITPRWAFGCQPRLYSNTWARGLWLNCTCAQHLGWDHLNFSDLCVQPRQHQLTGLYGGGMTGWELWNHEKRACPSQMLFRCSGPGSSLVFGHWPALFCTHLC